MRRILIATLTLLSAVCLGQTFSPERTGGVYYAYPVTRAVRLPLPSGYAPFYISHYGRHGSRWLPSAERYQWVLQQFGTDDAKLTPLGRSVKKRLSKICAAARGHAGALSPLGARQQRQIARRMARNYPEAVGGAGAVIRARSSTVARCRASMLAFCSELHRATGAPVTPETDARFMDYINPEPPQLKALVGRTQRQPLVSPRRFIDALFRQPPFRGDSAETLALQLLSELHTIAADMQDVPHAVSFWDAFTPEEMLAVHDANNQRMTITCGDTPLNDGIAARSSTPLWQNIAREADDAIAADTRGASLRFGHDTALYRLLTLLGLQLPGPAMEDFLPMAANVQLVFAQRAPRAAHDKDDGDGGVLVAFLLNERPARIPGLDTIGATPFHRWADVKAHVDRRLHRLEHLRQLSSLSTMVGTDQANTRSAGLFGKGSEERGQTLPAVLVPNGQTFWTPQTRPTERKCVAPFYYSDSLFQGIRASHWLVGGCTQDYGSFTVMAAAARGARSTADAQPLGTPTQDVVSHPHYYAASLPREQLRLEVTALSHAAIMRITPRSDGPVDIIVTVNSDQQLGTIAHDSTLCLVSAANPVHRIYQGWGQPAGFSGHFVLHYADSLLSAATAAPQQLTLTFSGRRGRPIELRMATSFTGPGGALANLRAEADGCTFEQMEQQCIDRWTERLHTIDASDPDTARVDQFYGSLYRASFLPREMSDADGLHPRFASGQPQPPRVPGAVSYCDFSIWDTYRALHPLYCLIVPSITAQMMQSLVDMSREGGWLPIFPCWNSYTAAMIGDHAASLLADAYVKGIRGFDAHEAYRAMRRNAFEQPEPVLYRDGRGRRALQSYLRWGYIPLEDSVPYAYHPREQASRTLEYAYDDFCTAQMARMLGHLDDYALLMQRSQNWRNAINPLTGLADGRHADGSWLGKSDAPLSRQPYITEGAPCHYAWSVPHDVPALIALQAGAHCTPADSAAGATAEEIFCRQLDSLFLQRLYWHGNEPCHHLPWLFALAGRPDLTARHVARIMHSEYNDTPGGLSGNDDAGQLSAWQLFAFMGFYPVCPATPGYALGTPLLRQVTIRTSASTQPFVIRRTPAHTPYRLNGQLLDAPTIDHRQILQGGILEMPEGGE